jgi:hypothetical protein
MGILGFVKGKQQQRFPVKSHDMKRICLGKHPRKREDRKTFAIEMLDGVSQSDYNSW